MIKGEDKDWEILRLRMNPERLQMKRFFNITEKRLLEYLEYVPLKKTHLEVESPYIFSMMMDSGAQIEPMMLKMIEIIKPYKINVHAQDLFGECYRYLNTNHMLSIQKLITKDDEDIILIPFSDSSPQWWKAYNNDIKHKLPQGIKSAKLKNLLYIYASLSIMHDIIDVFEIYIINPTEKIMDSKNWFDSEDDFKKNPYATKMMLVERGQVSKLFYNITSYKAVLNIPM